MAQDVEKNILLYIAKSPAILKDDLIKKMAKVYGVKVDDDLKSHIEKSLDNFSEGGFIVSTKDHLYATMKTREAIERGDFDQSSSS